MLSSDCLAIINYSSIKFFDDFLYVIIVKQRPSDIEFGTDLFHSGINR